MFNWFAVSAVMMFYIVGFWNLEFVVGKKWKLKIFIFLGGGGGQLGELCFGCLLKMKLSFLFSVRQLEVEDSPGLFEAAFARVHLRSKRCWTSRSSGLDCEEALQFQTSGEWFGLHHEQLCAVPAAAAASDAPSGSDFGSPSSSHLHLSDPGQPFAGRDLERDEKGDCFDAQSCLSLPESPSVWGAAHRDPPSAASSPASSVRSLSSGRRQHYRHPHYGLQSIEGHHESPLSRRPPLKSSSPRKENSV